MWTYKLDPTGKQTHNCRMPTIRSWRRTITWVWKHTPHCQYSQTWWTTSFRYALTMVTDWWHIIVPTVILPKTIMVLKSMIAAKRITRHMVMIIQWRISSRNGSMKLSTLHRLLFSHSTVRSIPVISPAMCIQTRSAQLDVTKITNGSCRHNVIINDVSACLQSHACCVHVMN